MALSSRSGGGGGGRGRAELPSCWKEREPSPEITKTATEPRHSVAERKVPVIYSLSRNGRLEQPHFMEVPLNSAEGLRLRDVINRLNVLRGKGIADMYSWSSKRSYKNGFVWHDLTEDDLIHTANGVEYVLKGSELLRDSPPLSQSNAVSIATSTSSCEKEIAVSATANPDHDLTKKTPTRRSFDLGEYRIYKPESTADAALKSVDVSTQTDDQRQQTWRAPIRGEDRSGTINCDEQSHGTELCRDGVSPLPSSSSPEMAETLTKADGDAKRTLGLYCSGRARASAVLINLISCCAISAKDHGLSMVSHCRARRPGTAAAEMVETRGFASARLEDKECFRGSMIATGIKGSDGVGGLAGFQRSSSYNADRSSKFEFAEKDVESVRVKSTSKKLGRFNLVGAALSARGSHGSKRINNVEVLNK